MKFDSLITETLSTGGKVYLLVWENSWEDESGEGYQLYGVYSSPNKAYEGWQQQLKHLQQYSKKQIIGNLQVLESVLDPKDATSSFYTNFKEVDIEHLRTLTNIGPEAAEHFGDIIKEL